MDWELERRKHIRSEEKDLVTIFRLNEKDLFFDIDRLPEYEDEVENE